MANERNWRPNDRTDRNERSDRNDRDWDDSGEEGQGQSGYGAGRREGDRSWSSSWDPNAPMGSRHDYGHPGHWSDDNARGGAGGAYLGQGGQEMGGNRGQGGMYGEGHYQQGMYGRGGSQDRYGSQGYQGWGDNDQPRNANSMMQHPRWPSQNDRSVNQSWAPGTSGMGYGNQPQHDQGFRSGQQPMQSHRGKGPQGYMRSDDRIREQVCEVLTDDHHVDATNIDVSVKNGEVTLSGTVDDRQQKRRAEDIIENLSGVRDVVNNLRLGAQTSARSADTKSSSAVEMAPREQAQQSGNGADKRHRA